MFSQAWAGRKEVHRAQQAGDKQSDVGRLNLNGVNATWVETGVLRNLDALLVLVARLNKSNAIDVLSTCKDKINTALFSSSLQNDEKTVVRSSL